ncbi:hypothetical protein HDK90DRAFT_193533 [Phyllosticta capitalensis]|uniref:NACHT-NTPase and P-loop NTPases N-terminal domain-containing protein n=1 Tax=Phyllosticta capitalensis TaxID=121624 RepID=A0ABR1YWZ3_9PEZI
MADAIGIAAGIIEFIKIGKKVIDLCKEIKHAPQKLIERQQQLDNNLRLFRTHADRSILLSDQEFATRIIKQCINRLQEIERLLKDLASQLKGGPTRRALASVSTVRKDAELQSSFDDLQRDMEILTSIFTGQSLAMLSSIEAGQIELRKELELLGYGQSEFRKEVISMIARLAPLKVPTTTIGNTIEPNTGDLDRKDVCDVRAQNAVFAYAKSVNSADELSGIPAPYSQGYPTSTIKCDCKSRPKLFLWSTGALSFRDKRGHHSDCPLFSGNDREVSVALRLAVPFASGKYLQFDCNTSWGAFGVSLSPGIKLRALVVDRNQSPAFACMVKLKRQFDRACLKRHYDRARFRNAGSSESAALAFCQSVLLELRPLLQRRPDLAHEQDKHGATILWDFISILGLTRTSRPVGYPEFTPAVTHCVAQVMKMMVVDHGADPNAIIHSSSRYSKVTHYNGQTIMDAILARPWMIHQHEELAGLEVVEDEPLEAVLNHFGFAPLKFSLDAPEYELTSKAPGRLSYAIVARLFSNPDLAEDLGCPDHYLAIFRKSKTELRSCTRRGVDWTKTYQGLPEPIVCALGWPQGLSFLLGLDLDAKDAVATAREYQLTEAIRVLISHHVPPFHQSASKSSSVSILGPYERAETRDMVFRYVADTRKELARLGLKNLQQGTQEWEHLQCLQQTETLVDEFALDVWKKLESSQTVPASKLRYLWPGDRKSVYAYSCSITSGINLERTKHNFRALLDLGFHNVEVAEEDGSTLFLRACSELQIPWASYIISKGARPDPKGLWLFVRKFLGHWGHPMPHPSWLMSLASDVGCDSCSCRCSTSGCSPAAVLVRKSFLRHPARRHELVLFTERMSSSARQVAMRELCRLEVFERLDMTHTCCYYSVKDDDAADIQEEEEHLNVTLNAFMSLFDHLFSHFDGHFKPFLRAWWAALDVFLPEEYPDISTKCDDCWLEPFAALHVRAHGHFKLLDEKGISNVVRHFHDVLAPLEASYFDKHNHGIFTTDGRIRRYLESLNVPENTFELIRDPHLNPLTYEDGPHRGYCMTDGREGTICFAKQYIVPLIAAGIIRDIERDAWFPEELRELLENEGVIVSGKLRPAHWKEDAEDVFERHRDIFEEQGSSPSI